MPSIAVSPALPGLLPTPLSGGLKRKRLYSEEENIENSRVPSQPPSSPSKRQKVRFDLNTDIKEIVDDKPFELVREEIRRALQCHAGGDNKEYSKLQDWFVPKASAWDTPSSKLLHKYIVALTGQIRQLEKSCNGLIKTILNSDWLGRDEAYVTAFNRFLCTLVSAHGANLYIVLEMLVGKFIDLPSTAGQISGHNPIEQSQLYNRVHHSIRSVLNLVPTANAALSHALSELYPFSKAPTKTQVSFVTNMLRIVDYTPEIRNFILGLLTERIIKLDLEIQEELDEDFEERADEVMHEILATSTEKTPGDESDDELDVFEDGEEEEQELATELTEEQRKFVHFKESVEKLDALLDVVFAYYESIFEKGASYDAVDVFEHMMTQFKHNILPTHHSRYTQFLLFHFAQTSEPFIDRFVDVCWAVVADKVRPVILRLAASSYLGSFIARGKRVPREVVRYSVNLLVEYLNEQRKRFELQASGPDIHRYASFYATFQVLMYIFCFRWQDLLDNEDPNDPETIMDIVYHQQQSNWLPGLKESMSMAMLSPLNPLKICAPGIVEQFVKIANNFNFLTADHIIQRNRTVRIVRPTVEPLAAIGARETALSGIQGDTLQLDDYFPFDPYYLPKSRRWLEGDYAEWEDPEGLRGEQDDAGADERDSSEERYRLAEAGDDESDAEEESESDYESD